MSKLCVTLVQSQTFWHDPQANRSLFESLVLGCQDYSDIFILPEVFTSGFTMDVKPFAETMEGPTVRKMKAWSKEKDAAVMGSLLIKDSGYTFNRLVCVFPDSTHQYYDKRHLFTYADEDKIVKAGSSRLIFEWRGWKICPLICYDLRFPAWARNNEEYDLLVYVANWPAARSYAWQHLIKARAIENQCYVAAVNRTGTDGRGLAYSGDSSVIDYSGLDLITLSDKASVKTIKIDQKDMYDFRAKFPFLKDQDHFIIN